MAAKILLPLWRERWRPSLMQAVPGLQEALLVCVVADCPEPTGGKRLKKFIIG